MTMDDLGEQMDKHTDETTNQLRRDHWRPRPGVIYGCGCIPGRLCESHAERRAIEHYSTELTP